MNQAKITVLSTHKSCNNIVISGKINDPKPMKIPGPNVYDAVPTTLTKHYKQPSTVFCHVGRDGGREPGESPGPGTYATGKSSSLSTLGSKFAGSDRLKDSRRRGNPGPGTYPITTFLNVEGGRSFAGMPAGPKKGGNPGPGTHDINYSQTDKKSGSQKFGTGSARGMPMSKTPGPGTYPIPTTQGINTESQFQTIPSMSFTSCSPGFGKKDETPGPSGLVTQF